MADAGCPYGGFCDDFDEGLLGARWSRVVKNAGNLELDATRFVSAPHAFRSTSPEASTPRPKYAFLERSVTPMPKAVLCSFAVRVNERYDASGWTDMFQILGEAPGVPEYELQLGMRGQTSGVRLDVNLADGGCRCPGAEALAAKPIPPMTWIRVMFETDFRAVNVTYDGQPVLSTVFDFGFTPTTVRLALGVDDYSTMGVDISYDDVACTFTY